MKSEQLLKNIKIASPCSKDWGKMSGNERVRFCGSCSKNVYNISEMTKEDAELFICKLEGSACLRLYRRRDGTIITDDCPIGLRKVRAGVWLLTRLVSGFLASLVAAMPSCAQVVDGLIPKLSTSLPEVTGTVEMGGLFITGMDLDEITDEVKSSKKKKRVWKSAIRKTKSHYKKGVLYQSLGDMCIPVKVAPCTGENGLVIKRGELVKKIA